MYLRIHVHTLICTLIYIYTCIYVHTCNHIHLYVSAYSHIYIIYTNMCMHIYIYIYIHTYTHIYIYNTCISKAPNSDRLWVLEYPASDFDMDDNEGDNDDDDNGNDDDDLTGNDSNDGDNNGVREVGKLQCGDTSLSCVDSHRSASMQ
jgi:hypothetical protein